MPYAEPISAETGVELGVKSDMALQVMRLPTEKIASIPATNSGFMASIKLIASTIGENAVHCSLSLIGPGIHESRSVSVMVIAEIEF